MFSTIKLLVASCYPKYTQRLAKIAEYKAASFPTCEKASDKSDENRRKSLLFRVETRRLLSLIASRQSPVAKPKSLCASRP